jgi:23S rRNA (adenine2503-C2)-methyltransferase
MKKLIKNLSIVELQDFFYEYSQPKYRAEQVFKELYLNRVSDFSAMTTIPKDFREILDTNFHINSITEYQTQKSADGTIKFLFQLRDGQKIESVLIPDERRKSFDKLRMTETDKLRMTETDKLRMTETVKLRMTETDKLRMSETDKLRMTETNKLRMTLCVSSQVGCTLNCTFCATGKLGFKRNLETAEIIDQMLFAEKVAGVKLSNIVFMGMGEPTYNLANVIKAIKIISSPNNQLLSPKRITVSTVGVVKKMRELADSGLKVKLAVSLHATNDLIRQQLMPYAERVTLKAIGDAIEYYYRKTKLDITYEYILLPGINNTDNDVKRLSKITKRVPSKVNIIPYHSISFIEGSNTPYKEPTKDEIKTFTEKLKVEGVNVFLRTSSGKDIDAACGQLAYSQRNS